MDRVHVRRERGLALLEIQHGEQSAVVADLKDAAAQLRTPPDDLGTQDELGAHQPEPAFELQEHGVDAGFRHRVERASRLQVGASQGRGESHRPVDLAQVEVQGTLGRQACGDFQIAVGQQADLGAIHPPGVGIAEHADSPAGQTGGPYQRSFKNGPLLRGKPRHP